MILQRLMLLREVVSLSVLLDHFLILANEISTNYKYYFYLLVVTKRFYSMKEESVAYKKKGNEYNKKCEYMI